MWNLGGIEGQAGDDLRSGRSPMNGRWEDRPERQTISRGSGSVKPGQRHQDDLGPAKEADGRADRADSPGDEDLGAGPWTRP